MTLKLELQIASPEASPELNPACLIRLTNRGSQPIDLVHPAIAGSLPIWKGARVGGGAAIWGGDAPNLFKPEHAMPLRPGESFEHEARLLDHLPLREPGEYDVTIAYEWDKGRGRARSAPARVKYRGSEPTYANFASFQGHSGADMAMLWIDSAPAKPQFMFSRLALGLRPSIRDTRAVGPARGDERPILSVPYNGEHADQHWAIWIEEDHLYGLRLRGDGPPKKWSTYEEKDRITVTTTIIPPLLPVGELPGQFAVAAMLCRDRGPGKQASLLARIVSDSRMTDSIAYGPDLLIGTGMPLWAEGVALSNGSRRVYMIGQPVEERSAGSSTWGAPARAASADVEGLVFQTILWSRENVERLELCDQATYDGEFVAAGLSLGADDTVRGAFLIRDEFRPGGKSVGMAKLQLVRWTHSPDGRLRLENAVEMPWDGKERIEEARVIVSGDGEAIILIRVAKGEWRLSFPARPELKDAKRIGVGIDLLLARADGRRPLLVMSAPAGFSIGRP